jgi:chloride channel 3/4/5
VRMSNTGRASPFLCALPLFLEAHRNTCSNFSSIDWQHEYAKERVRQQEILSHDGLDGVLARLADALKPWIVIILTGIICSLL